LYLPKNEYRLFLTRTLNSCGRRFYLLYVRKSYFFET
jgi:hypothetical protein